MGSWGSHVGSAALETRILAARPGIVHGLGRHDRMEGIDSEGEACFSEPFGGARIQPLP
jgi:hypothetical protein